MVCPHVFKCLLSLQTTDILMASRQNIEQNVHFSMVRFLSYLEGTRLSQAEKRRVNGGHDIPLTSQNCV
jgi:hypothetical protein